MNFLSWTNEIDEKTPNSLYDDSYTKRISKEYNIIEKNIFQSIFFNKLYKIDIPFWWKDFSYMKREEQN